LPFTFAAVKKLLAAILLILFVFQWVYPATFTIWFFANRAAIAAKYCENKQRPQLHCDGKCFLAKKLQALDAKQANTENAALRNVWVETQPCIVQESFHPGFPYKVINIDQPVHQPEDYRYTFVSILLRPPSSEGV
jgi:hypothetical protein